MLEDQERKLFENYKAKEPEAVPTPKPQRKTPEVVSNLLILAPAGGLKADDLDKVRRKIGKDIQYIFVAGSKRSYRDFSAAFPSASATLIENHANAEILRGSPKTLTVDLRAND